MKNHCIRILYNRITVNHEKSELILVRDNITMHFLVLNPALTLAGYVTP
jgi:hypothetical protein